MDLYLDFDGVILDTIPVLYKALEDNNIDLNDLPGIRKFFSEIDWENIVNTTPQINKSIPKIKKLIKSEKYNIRILTHVNSEQEVVAKKKFVKKHFPDMEVIAVPKSIKKCDFLDDVSNAILVDDFTPNLDEWYTAGGISIKFGTTDKESKYFKISSLDEMLHIEIDKGSYEKHIS